MNSSSSHCHRRATLLAIAALFLGACSTLREVAVETFPANAKVSFKPKHSTKTIPAPIVAPAVTKLEFPDANAGWTLSAEAPGFAPAEQTLTTAQTSEQGPTKVRLVLPPKVDIQSKPASSTVSVRAKTTNLVTTGTTPHSPGLDFAANPAGFTIEVSPSEQMKERYLAESIEMTKEKFDALPLNPATGAKLLDVALREKEFVTLNIVEVVLDDRRRWRGVVTPTRAFERITEAGGARPSQIVEFGENLGVQGLALSPDGSRIVYSVASLPADSKLDAGAGALDQTRILDLPGANIHAVNINGGGVQHVTSDNFRDMFPSFSPDGKYLLFSSNRRRPEKADLLRINVESLAGISNIYIDNREAIAMKPTQGADGTIVFSLEREVRTGHNFSEIWTIGGANQYPTMIGEGAHPAVSPSGDKVAYIGTDQNLWVMNVNGAGKTQLTFDANKIMQRYRTSLTESEQRIFDHFQKQGFITVRPYSYPSWTPNGNAILFTAMEGNDPTGRPNEDIWIMSSDGANKRQLTTNGSTDRYPLVSRDSQHAFFLSNRGKRWAIWRIPVTI